MIIRENIKSNHTYLFSFIVSFLVIFSAAWLGIFTRPFSHFAFFWPANAILLGLFICYPNLKKSAVVLGSFIAYVLADLITGSGWLLSLVLTIGNYISIGIAFFLSLQFTKYFTHFKPNYYFNIYPYFLSILIASAISSLCMIITLPYVPDNFLIMGSFFSSFLNWWSAELFNYALVLPIIMSFPRHNLGYFSVQDWTFGKWLSFILPLILIALSVVLTHKFFSEGALLYPLATLIWAATVYRFFTLAVISSIVGLTLYHSLSDLNFYTINQYTVHPMISIRIGLLIMILCALVMGVMNMYRKRLYEEVNYLRHFDSLTQAMNRESFLKTCQSLIKSKRQYPLTFVKIEIDQLAQIHEQYGLSIGDQLLKNFAKEIQQKLRTQDLFCRIGTDEFMLLIQKLPIEEGIYIAKRLQEEIKNLEIETEDGETLNISISLGISHCPITEKIHIEQAITYADKALLQAKMQGFNQLNIHKHIVAAL